MKYTIFPEQARKIATAVNFRESYFKPTLDEVYHLIRMKAERGEYMIVGEDVSELLEVWDHTESQVDGCGEYIEEQLSQIGYEAEYNSVDVTLTVRW